MKSCKNINKKNLQKKKKTTTKNRDKIWLKKNLRMMKFEKTNKNYPKQSKLQLK
jgi:hypothetical protein